MDDYVFEVNRIRTKLFIYHRNQLNCLSWIIASNVISFYLLIDWFPFVCGGGIFSSPKNMILPHPQLWANNQCLPYPGKFAMINIRCVVYFESCQNQKSNHSNKNRKHFFHFYYPHECWLCPNLKFIIFKWCIRGIEIVIKFLFDLNTFTIFSIQFDIIYQCCIALECSP